MRVFDLHCDTITECYDRRLSLRDNRELHIALERGRKYDPWVQCFAVWISDTLRGQAAVRYFDRAASFLRQEAEKNQEEITICINKEDFNKLDNKCGAVLTVEGGAVLAGDLDNIARLRQQGVRAMTLTWNGGCEIGDGAMVRHPSGLTPFGRQAIPLLEENNIVVDVSHASDPLFDDVAALAKRPFIATHSNSRGVCDHPRNLTDRQFGIIRDRGGLVGLNLYRDFLREDGHATLDDVFRHVYHFLELGGEGTLAMGTDFDGCDVLEAVSGIQDLTMLAEYFYTQGLQTRLIDRIVSENAKDFFDSL